MGRSVGRREEMLGHVKDWEKSGQTQAEYCKTHGLSYYSFDYWRRCALKAPQAAHKRAFIPVIPEGGSAMRPPNGEIEIVLIGGSRLRWPIGRSIEELAHLVRALSRP